jgi:crotonobetainyl-CoA:carnitine CoA-transferase CaiB-like acyl-CoA transferase
MPGACAGIRVLDASSGDAGSLATMVLADFGAEVVRVEPPGSDPRATMPAYLLLQRGKKSITLDLESLEGGAELHRLLPGFDVLVTDGPGDDLLARHPALVVCSITGFGSAGPFAGTPAVDSLVMAKAGIFRDQPGWERDGKRPIYRSCPDGTYFAGMLAVQGVLAALRARDLTGRGQRVDLNMLLAITCRQNPQVRCLRREGEELPVDQAASTETVSDAINPLAHHRDPREVTLTGMLVECKDGRWIMHSLSEPHFFRAWIEAIGFGWIRDDERFAGAPWTFPDDDAKVELVTRLQARMKEQEAEAIFKPIRSQFGPPAVDFVGPIPHPAMNAMFASVAYRTREIGTLQVLGFRRRQVLMAFLLESVLLAVVGGILGGLLAIPIHGVSTGTMNFNTFSELAFHFRITPGMLVSGIGFAALMGAFGGFLPALLASRRTLPGHRLRRGAERVAAGGDGLPRCGD